MAESRPVPAPDTIFAAATPPGRAGLGVIRISGGQAIPVAEALSGGPLPPAGRSLRRLREPDGSLIDEVLVLTFAAGASFTGEPVVELHHHGSPAVQRSLLHILGSNPSLRQAVPGEFTRRAFQNRRLRLDQVEGLADLIDAETDAQRRLALRLFTGALGDMVAGLRARLVAVLALFEALIDFSDEDLPFHVRRDAEAQLAKLRDDLAREIKAVAVAERVRSGFEIAIIGAPNVGKSTLVNKLAGRPVALTSPEAGTTRDVIEVRLDVGGYPVTFVDTAGIRDRPGGIEAMGIALAIQRAEQADLRLHLCSADQGPAMPPMPQDIVLMSKADLGCEGPGLRVSGLTGEGIDELLDQIRQFIEAQVGQISQAAHPRHADAFRQATAGLDRALAELRHGREELVAESIRHAIGSLDLIVGQVDVEEVLGAVFARFCIGK